MLRMIALCILALGVSSVTALAQASPAKEEKKTDVAFEEIALKEALATLAKAADVEIKLDEGVAGDDTVSLSLKNTSVESILNMIKELLDLTWEVKNGAVLAKKSESK